MDITEFLIACLDEDQAAAKAEPGGSWYGPQVITDAHGRPRWRIERSPFDSGVPIADCFEAATALHLLRHDPARVLREVAAKRRVLARHHAYGGGGADHNACYGCGLGNDGEPLVKYVNDCPELRDMASVYADRPGYKEEWKP